mmetsp:Transcript_88694/g.236086  ORF Transcript_88694/g.236086 Transcript_88694/m.236086 type:complete len:225 (-) Transcript_88694:1946-2620(-)
MTSSQSTWGHSKDCPRSSSESVRPPSSWSSSSVLSPAPAHRTSSRVSGSSDSVNSPPAPLPSAAVRGVAEPPFPTDSRLCAAVHGPRPRPSRTRALRRSEGRVGAESDAINELELGARRVRAAPSASTISSGSAGSDSAPELDSSRVPSSASQRSSSEGGSHSPVPISSSRADSFQNNSPLTFLLPLFSQPPFFCRCPLPACPQGSAAPSKTTSSTRVAKPTAT